MSSFNQVVLMGNITRDPQTKQVGGSSVTEFGVAVNRKYKTAGGEQREEVAFVDCAAWGKQGEVIAKFMGKGRPILVQGRLKQDVWEKDGAKRSKLSVVVENFQFVGGRDGGGQGTGGGGGKGKGADNPFPDAGEFNDSSIPF